MIIETLIEQLRALRLHGMAESLERQLKTDNHDTLHFEERLHLMLQNERVERDNQTYMRRRRWAKIPIPEARLEDIDHSLPRDFDRPTLKSLYELGWIKKRLNLLLIGPTGVGKSFIASALADAACRADYSVRCFRMCKLAEQLAPRGRPDSLRVGHFIQRRALTIAASSRPRSQLLSRTDSSDRLACKLLCAVTLCQPRTSAFGRLRFAFGADQEDGFVDIRIESRRNLQTPGPPSRPNA